MVALILRVVPDGAAARPRLHDLGPVCAARPGGAGPARRRPERPAAGLRHEDAEQQGTGGHVTFLFLPDHTHASGALALMKLMLLPHHASGTRGVQPIRTSRDITLGT